MLEGEINPLKVDSSEQIANIFTKALSTKFEEFRQCLGPVPKVITEGEC